LLTLSTWHIGYKEYKTLMIYGSWQFIHD